MPCRLCGSTKPDCGTRCTFTGCPVRDRARQQARTQRPAAQVRRSLISQGRIRPKSGAA